MRRLFILICVILLANISYSQKVSIGPELGLNIIPIENTNYGYNYQLGFHFGGHLKYHISDKFKISTGLFLTQKKKQYSFSDTSSVFETYSQLFQFGGIDEEEVDSIAQSFGANTDVYDDTKGMVSEIFIKIPVLANFKFKNFNTYIGPYFGVLLTATKKQETRTQIPLLNVIDISQFDSTGFASAFLPAADETSTSKRSDTKDLNIIDIGMNLGIGYEMNNLHFNLMYSQGFLDYRKDKGDENFSPLRTFRLSIVYLFDLEKKNAAAPRLD